MHSSTSFPYQHRETKKKLKGFHVLMPILAERPNSKKTTNNMGGKELVN